MKPHFSNGVVSVVAGRCTGVKSNVSKDGTPTLIDIHSLDNVPVLNSFKDRSDVRSISNLPISEDYV